ncbi:MAG TPA: sensor histidine kinase, partial [Steroidobacteraceae bacterium]|nr:sensor histidine kinase [Steroidobacteraceae bacterium]
LAELQHRVRNVLAVIRSMMRRSSESQDSLSEYVQHLEGRLSALARTQVLLTRAADARVDLEDLIRDELLAQAANEERVTISGPRVGLGPKAAEVVSLAIHELTTNAVKYGALTRESATLSIGWQVEERASVPWLKLLWSELGVSVTGTAPRRHGFGTELITRRVPYELKGKGTLEMRPGGIECELEFPLLDRASILQTDAGRKPAEEVTG